MIHSVKDSSLAIASPVRAPQAADWALSHGLSSLTTQEAAELLGTTANQVPQRLATARKRGEWMTPARGLWVPVPPEYRMWGGSPALEFIDAMLAHLKTEYYLGWLSAAAVHGAAHHAPQVTQVAVSRMIRSRVIGRVRLEFFVRRNLSLLPYKLQTVRSGNVRVSTIEVTALDLCSDIATCGGMDNVATVIASLAEACKLSVQTIVKIGEFYSPAAVRRLGWLLENYANLPDLCTLQAYAHGCSKAASVLDPLNKPGGTLDKKWMVRINSKVEVED